MNLSMENIKKLFVGDRWIWFVILFLTMLSFFSVYSSSSSSIAKHGALLILGVGTAVVISRVHPKYFSGFAEVMLMLGIGGLLLTFVLGKQINDSSRWIQIGSFTLQPSEFAKFALIVFTAKRLALAKDPTDAFWSIISTTFITCAIIMPQNLSTCLLTAVSVFILMLIGGVSIKRLAVVAVVLITLFVSIIALAPQIKSVIPRAMTWRARVERFVGVETEEGIQKSDGNYQLDQALEGVATGGLMGRGPGRSYKKNVLPMASSDFIFSIILEEYGAWGGLLVVSAFILLMFRAIIIMKRCQKPFHAFLIIGVVIIIEFQALINMCVGVGLMPVTGQTLPFVSMGGSSILFIGFAFGMMLSVSYYNPAPVIETKKEEEPKQKAPSASDVEYYEEAEAVTF